jgi:hypothetical protein
MLVRTRKALDVLVSLRELLMWTLHGIGILISSRTLRHLPYVLFTDQYRKILLRLAT